MALFFFFFESGSYSVAWLRSHCVTSASFRLVAVLGLQEGATVTLLLSSMLLLQCSPVIAECDGQIVSHHCSLEWFPDSFPSLFL